MKDKKELIKSKLEQILKHLDIRPTIVVEEDSEGFLRVTLDGYGLNHVIGYHGESLDAIQTLLELMLFREMEERIRLSVDINGYRDQRIEKIEQITKGLIDRVRFSGQNVEMLPMNPRERRVVHEFIAQYPDIASESTGEGRQRRVVLKPKK